jgi:hypothetical protein
MLQGRIPWVRLQDANLQHRPHLLFLKPKDSPPPGYTVYTGPLPAAKDLPPTKISTFKTPAIFKKKK